MIEKIELEKYLGYAITKDGRVWSSKTNRWLKQGHNGAYKTVGLCINGKSKTTLVHRIIAETLIPNPNNKRTINHIDGNKFNNNIDNLEWATYKENRKHALDTGLHTMTDEIKNKISNSHKKPIRRGDGKEYSSIQEANIDMGFSKLSPVISRVAKGKRPHAGGYHWEYV